MSQADHVAIPGGFLIQRPGGQYVPFTFVDFHSARSFLRIHPHASTTHYEEHRRWRITRAIDGVCVS